ncbi:MAG TPA: DUF3224 domain-containing protein [Gemmatimonadales bacterium]|nr:DUF3224 domain-containing protein [Gemmatimonadales bacterium]
MPQSPQTATAKFEMPSWDEQPIVEYDDGRKLTHAKVTKKFTGDLVGESVLEYLMVYPPEPPVPYVGVERFVGTFLGKKGSFALTITGTYDGRAREKAMIIAGSGTGELANLRGSRSFGAGHEDKVAGFEVEYWWA